MRAFSSEVRSKPVVVWIRFAPLYKTSPTCDATQSTMCGARRSAIATRVFGLEVLDNSSARGTPAWFMNWICDALKVVELPLLTCPTIDVPVIDVAGSGEPNSIVFTHP